MKKRNLLLVILAVLLVFGMVVSCGPVEEDKEAVLTVTPNGSATATTTQLTLALTAADPADDPPPSITSGEITLTGAENKGFSGGVLTIDVTKVATKASFDVTVTVKKSGYKTVSKTVTVYCLAADAAKNYYGSYQATYMLGSTLTPERIIFDGTSMTIVEIQNSQISTTDYFKSTITKWEFATPLADNPKYSVAFKITGNVSDAKPYNATGTNAPNLYGGKTAPGFSSTDITSKTECWMFIYIEPTDDNDGDILRSPYSKAGKDNGNAVVTGSNTDESAIRVYKQQ